MTGKRASKFISPKTRFNADKQGTKWIFLGKILKSTKFIRKLPLKSGVRYQLWGMSDLARLLKKEG
jgi:hypothetical protein